MVWSSIREWKEKIQNAWLMQDIRVREKLENYIYMCDGDGYDGTFHIWATDGKSNQFFRTRDEIKAIPPPSSSSLIQSMSALLLFLFTLISFFVLFHSIWCDCFQFDYNFWENSASACSFTLCDWAWLEWRKQSTIHVTRNVTELELLCVRQTLIALLQRVHCTMLYLLL